MTLTRSILRAPRALLPLVAIVLAWPLLLWGGEPTRKAASGSDKAGDSGAAEQGPQMSAATQRLVAGGDPVLNRATSSGHGWAYIPGRAGGEVGAAGDKVAEGHLLHFVPRQGVPRASAGSVRVVMALQKSPLALAGWDGEVLLLLGPTGDEAVSQMERSLSTLKASGPVSLGNWSYRPADRLELKAALPRDTVPRSMVGSALGPVLVWERVMASSGELEIAVLDDSGAWRLLQPPAGFPMTAADGEAFALSTESGVMVAVRLNGERALTLWRTSTVRSRADLNARVREGSLPVLTRWDNAGTAVLPAEVRGAPLRTMGATAGQWLWRDGGQTLLASRVKEGMTLWRLDAAEPIRLWHSESVPTTAGAMVMGGLGAVSLLEYDRAGESHTGGGGLRSSARGLSAEPGRLRVVEVSSSTGVVLADLPAHTDGFFSRNELWVLWMLFIGIGVVILWVVVSIDGPQELQLPEGTALASPLRRVLAGSLDLFIAVGLTSVLVGSSPSHWFSPATSTSSSMLPLLSVIGIGFALATAGEATIGCSPGKLLVGSRVLGVVPLKPAVAPAAGETGKRVKSGPTIWQVARPRFYQALLRNTIRWFMPPMGMMMIVDNNWRHPGDILARTVVVVRFDPRDEGGVGEDR